MSERAAPPAIKALVEQLGALVPDCDARIEGGIEPNVIVAPCAFPTVMSTLHQRMGMDFLSDLTAVDRFEQIEMVYRLHRLADAASIVVKVRLPRADPRIPTVMHLWRGAEVQEREAYDLMGVYFEGHPRLRRILLWDEFIGYPLRKDFVSRDHGEPAPW